jgi:syntaxin-binding protein 1
MIICTPMGCGMIDCYEDVFEQEVIEDLTKGELSKDEYPYMREPSAAVLRSMACETGSVRTSKTQPQSQRTSKPTSTWATKAKPSDDGNTRYIFVICLYIYRQIRTEIWLFDLHCKSWGHFRNSLFLICDSESSLRHAHSDTKITGKRIFIFMIGGATRSEVFFVLWGHF